MHVLTTTCYNFRLLHITVYGDCVNHGNIVAMKIYAAATKITIYGPLCKYSVFNLENMPSYRRHN